MGDTSTGQLTIDFIGRCGAGLLTIGLGAGLGITLLSCGGEESSSSVDAPKETPKGAESTTNQAGVNRSLQARSTPTGGVAVSSPRPGQAEGRARPSQAPKIQVFSPQRPRLRDDYPEVAALINPAHPDDPWPGELLAVSAESSLVAFLTALRDGEGKRIRGMITRDLKGRVLGPDGSPSPASGDQLLASLRQQMFLADPSVTQPGVLEVSVIEVEAPPLVATGQGGSAPASQRGRTVARVTLGTRPETHAASRTQVHATIEVVWRLGRRVRIEEVALLDVKRVAMAPPFREVTSAIVEVDLQRDHALNDVLRHGALEAMGRTDRLVAYTDISLALHGAAVGDLDGDGWEDVVVGRAGGQPNLCLMNRGGRLKEEGALRGLDALEDTGGMLIADMDGDGARDVVFGRGRFVAICWNDGKGYFSEVTALESPGGTGRVYSLSAADVDGDGDLDLYDTRYFRRGGYGAQAPTPYHDAMNGSSNVFWRNLLVDETGAAARGFRDDTESVGLNVDNDRFSLSSVFDDFDGDGDLDLYVANDFGQNNLYVWNGSSFDVSSDESGLTDKAAGMGVCVADVDLDGLSDLVISNMHSAAGMRVTREPQFGLELTPAMRAEFARHARGNTLYKGLGAGRFKDVTDMTGAAPGGWAWGGRFVDWDRDGLMDIVVPNGFLSGRHGPDLQSFFWRRVVGTTPMSINAPEALMDYYLAGWSVISHLSQFGRQHWNGRERTFAYGNRGGFKFDDLTLASGIGFADDGRALVTADLDRDGRLDLIFRNRTSPILRVLQGVHEGGHWLSLALEGHGPNWEGIGARVTIEAGGVARSVRVTAGDGFLGSSTKAAHFGLAELETVSSVSVTWPDGTVEAYAAEPGGESLVNGAWVLERGRSDPRLVGRGEASMPSLDRKLQVPMAAAQPGPPESRVPLLAEIPLGAWRLPFFQQAEPAPSKASSRRLDQAGGPGGTLVLCWSSKIPSSVEALRELRGAEAQLEAAGVRLHPLTLDSVRDEVAALDVLTEMGFAGDRSGGRASRMDRTVLELITARTLAPYDDVPLPFGLLFDSEGDLVLLYVDAVEIPRLMGDVKAIGGREDPSSTLTLTGGRWTGEPMTRSLKDVPAKLRSLGMEELADHLAARL